MLITLIRASDVIINYKRGSILLLSALPTLVIALQRDTPKKKKKKTVLSAVEEKWQHGTHYIVFCDV